MKIVIDGATSMIGVALIQECIANNIEVLAIVRHDSKKRARVPKSDLVSIVNDDELTDIKGSDFDAYYHFAWKGTTKQGRNDPYIQLENIGMTLDAIELAHRLGCKMFVGAGSQAEYGVVKGRISEDLKVAPQTFYGISKHSASIFAFNRCAELGMTCLWARIFSVYGCNDTEQSMVSYAIKCYLHNFQAEFSMGENWWNFLYETDAARLLLLFVQKNVPSGIYNVANPKSQLLKDYIREIGEAVPLPFNYALVRESSDINLDVDMSKSCDATGFEPQVSFKDGIAKIVASRSRAKL